MATGEVYEHTKKCTQWCTLGPENLTEGSPCAGIVIAQKQQYTPRSVSVKHVKYAIPYIVFCLFQFHRNRECCPGKCIHTMKEQEKYAGFIASDLKYGVLRVSSDQSRSNLVRNWNRTSHTNIASSDFDRIREFLNLYEELDT